MEQQRIQRVDLEKIQSHLSRYRGDLCLIQSSQTRQHKVGKHSNAGDTDLFSVYQLLQHMHASITQDIAELEKLLLQSGQQQSGQQQTVQNTKQNSKAFDAGASDFHALSCKEHEVLNMFAKGYSYNEVAVLLDCKLATIQTHSKRIYKKLRVHSRSEAVYEARQMDIIVI